MMMSTAQGGLPEDGRAKVPGTGIESQEIAGYLQDLVRPAMPVPRPTRPGYLEHGKLRVKPPELLPNLE
jgi:hypothetical protein